METEITTSSVTLTWNQPDSEPPFIYEVQVKNVVSNNYKPSILTNNTTETVADLESGSNYSFTVTTLTADSTRAESVVVFYYTSKCNVACKGRLQMSCANMLLFFFSSKN